MKNRKREICTSGTVRDEDGNILIYSANDRGGLRKRRHHSKPGPRLDPTRLLNRSHKITSATLRHKHAPAPGAGVKVKPVRVQPQP
jgi:hypothetical protein